MNLNNRILWSSLKIPGVTVSVRRQSCSAYTVLKVASLIDTGRPSQTAILENAFPGMIEEDPQLLKLGQSSARNHLAIPPKIANLNCVFTGRRPRLVADAYCALKSELASAKFMPVVPDVIAPGDYMIFRHLQNRACFKLAGLLRAVPSDTSSKTRK